MTSPPVFDVRDHGARGDGRAIDSAAINRAIEVAASAGGGIVMLPAGRFLCFSIRLASGITLLLAEDAVIEAADPARHPGRYDLPEPAPEALYQDFGHSHWHNSLIWGDGIANVAILGPGRIEGSGLTRDGPGARWRKQTGERPLSMAGMSETEIRRLEPQAEAMTGLANKAVALKNCRNVRLSGFTILKGGHFALLATGVENLVVEDLAIDTDRDGIDLDCVRNATVSRCRVNTPNDDAIVLRRTATGSPGGSSWAPKAMAAFATSSSAIAASKGRGGWRWRRWTAACSRMSRCAASSCARSPPRRSSCGSATAGAARRGRASDRCVASRSATSRRPESMPASLRRSPGFPATGSRMSSFATFVSSMPAA